MHLILRYSNGRRAEALLLSMTSETMRVILHRRDETLEFRLVAGRWIGDDGTRVSVEAMIPAGIVETAGDRGLTLRAGG
jgi:hypothetical protein